MIEQLLSKRQIAERLSVHWTTIDRWRRYRAFPAPLQVAGLNRWKSSDIEQWLQAKPGLMMDALLPASARFSIRHGKPE